MMQPRKTARQKPDRDIVKLQEEVSETVGAKVSIRHGAKGKGKISIEYKSLDQLDGILERLGIKMQ
jgi:ParB family chromosome partitioning protein